MTEQDPTPEPQHLPDGGPVGPTPDPDEALTEDDGEQHYHDPAAPGGPKGPVAR